MDKFKVQKKNSEITEDDLKALEESMQKITDKYTKEVDKICESKNKEIMEI
ncbi:MAG: ribosome recycling factor [Ruthenibacterium sp.]